jgi:antigen flippase
MDAARQIESAPPAEPTGASFRSILKSTSLIGGASVINILIGMVRTKFVAVLLGPAGVGLLGMYTQIATLASTFSGMGIANSGVRQVAEAVGTNDQARIARTVRTLRRTAWVTGALGMLVMVAFALPISKITFEDRSHALPIALLGVTVLLGQIAAGQSCLLRGTRKIADVARVTVLGSLSSTLVSIPCYFAWGVRGIVAALVLSAVSALAVSWWYARRVPVEKVPMSWGESRGEARSLLSLGLSFMGAGLLGTATTYLIQTILIRQFGLTGLGIYQAAFSLSGALVGFVLAAMGADYYPRLTAVAGDDVSVRKMVNEQTQVSLLLALPGLAAVVVFSPLIIRLFYARDFDAAVPILRWCVFGIVGRVLSWPLGFVVLAKGRGRLFFVTEAFACSVHVLAVLLLTRPWGLVGAGAAFAVLYVAYAALMLLVMRALAGSSWSRSTVTLAAAATLGLAMLTLNSTLNPEPLSRWGLGALGVATLSYACLRELLRRSRLSFSGLVSRAL